MRPVHPRAGTAMVETALTLGFTLMLLIGAIEIGLVGYYQMQLDGATFFFAHSVAVDGGSANPAAINAALKHVFRGVATNMSPVYAAPPVTSVPVNFTQWGQLNSRYGGASVVRPQRVQAQSSMRLDWLNVLGKGTTLTAGNVDGRAMVGNHDDDAQGAGFNSTTATNTMVDPITADDQNVPPYYINLSFISFCQDAPPWGPSCSTRTLRAIGLGEFLKDDNYNTPQNGVGPGGTFETVACHQRIYADLAAAFPAARPAYSPGGDYDQVNGPASVPAWNGASFQLVYSWDYMPVQGESANARVGRLYPMPVSNGCGPGEPGA